MAFLFFCTKTRHLFKCSPAQVHTEPLSCLWTLNISMGESRGEWVLHLLYELFLMGVRGGAYIGHKTVMAERKSKRVSTVSHSIDLPLTVKNKHKKLVGDTKTKGKKRHQFKTTA